ncbi:MAG TPA: ribose ABC transporter permease [Firmicutes bacterium]|nr:ribose ABC transporter permease [Bacillota bacterium]
MISFRAGIKRFLGRRETGAFIALLLMSIALSFISSFFFTFSNMINVIRQVSLNAIISVGMTLVILTGGIDLSVGSVVALSGTISASLMAGGVNMWVAILIGILIGAVAGLINGLTITKLNVPPIITTLAMMTAARGIALVYTNGYPISNLPDSFVFLGRGYWGPIPIPGIIMVVIYILGYILLTQMKVGRYIYGLGGNEEAVHLSGISVTRIKILVYTICGIVSAVSGLILASRLDSGQPLAGSGFEMDAIAAVIIGGASISGGEGTMIGTIIGALIMNVLNNGLNLMNVNPYSQQIVKGVVLAAAVAIRTHKTKKS